MAQTKKIEIEIALCGGSSVVHVQGDINWKTSPELRTAILDLIQSQPQERVIVNLRGVSHLDSSGISSFIEALEAAKKKGSRFILSGLNESIRHVLVVTRLNRIFEITATVAQALR